MLEGIAAVTPVGVHHRDGTGQLLPALVVVGDHHVQPQRVGVVHLFHPGDAAVHRYQQAHALVIQALDGVAAEAVAVLDAPGNVVHHVCAPALEIVHQDAGGRDAVHVVVAEHGELLPVVQRLLHPRNGLVHILHPQRTDGQPVLPLQKGRSRLRRLHASGRQHGGHQIRIPRLPQALLRLRMLRRDVPLAEFHGVRLLSGG